jgi:hypothetical protein
MRVTGFYSVVKVTCLAYCLVILQACSGITVSQDYERGFNFSEYKTYAWLPENVKQYGLKDNDLVNHRIRDAMVRHLDNKGYQQAEDGAPDFYISYQMSVEQRVSSTNVSGGIAIGRGAYGHMGGIGITTAPHARVYDQGKLSIDITDAATSNLVWRGLSTQQMSQHSEQEKMTEIINETVNAVLDQFPPGS